MKLRRHRRYGSIPLAMAVVHPFFENDVAALVGLARHELRAVLRCKKRLVAAGAPVPITDEQEEDSDDVGTRGIQRRLETVLADPDRLSEAGRQVYAAFAAAQVSPAWALVHHVLVVPTALRPMVPGPAAGPQRVGLNDHYRHLVDRSDRARKLLEFGCPDHVTRVSESLLAKSIWEVFANEWLLAPTIDPEGHVPASLASLVQSLTGVDMPTLKMTGGCVEIAVQLRDLEADAYELVALMHALGFEVEGLETYDVLPEGALATVPLPDPAAPPATAPRKPRPLLS